MLGAIGQILLQEIVQLFAITAVEGLKPRRALTTSGSIGKLRLAETKYRLEKCKNEKGTSKAQSPALPARVEPAGIEDCGTRSSGYFESLAHDRSGQIVYRGQLKEQGGGARRGQLRHGEAMS